MCVMCLAKSMEYVEQLINGLIVNDGTSSEKHVYPCTWLISLPTLHTVACQSTSKKPLTCFFREHHSEAKMNVSLI